MRIRITNGRLLNPADGRDEVTNLLIEDDKIAAIGQDADQGEADREINAEGCYVMPGLIDLHVHLRDPGLTEKADIESESRAAARGGFTTICAMPNTKPVADNMEVIRYVEDKAKEVGLVNVVQAGCLTKGMEGKELSDIAGMLRGGVRVFSEDGKSVMNSRLFRDAMRLIQKEDGVILDHCEDINLVEGGVMNDGEASRRLGFRGIANDVENIIEARDIMIAEELGARLHLCHCSTKESVSFVKDAKKRGIQVTAEVCPHHFAMSEEDIPGDDANYKMNPPLRKREDMEALRAGLADGIMEVISTDHAPHTAEEKSRGFEKAPFGIVGLETSVQLSYTELVKTGLITPLSLASKMSYLPAQILKNGKGDLSVGKIADLVIFDPRPEVELHASDLVGKAKNMPYEGRKVFGNVVLTMLSGKITYSSQSI